MIPQDSIREAWGRYVSSGRIVRDLLRPAVYRYWERAHDLGASPLQFHAQTLSSLETERLLARRESLIKAAQPFMASLSQAAGTERHAAMLGDVGAIVLDVVGDEQSVHGPERVPGPGSLLSEDVTGCNGIGTPLAESDYAEMVGAEHFIGGFHPFTCQGIPLRDQGQIIGVLSTSVRRPAASMRLRDILVSAAHGIEAELIAQRIEGQMQRLLSAQPGDKRIFENLRQDVFQNYAVAKLHFETVARLLPVSHPGSVIALLKVAQEAIAEFRQHALLWQELASSEIGVPQAVDLAILVRQIIQLLETEMATQGVEVVLSEPAPLLVQADRRQVLRQLLQGFLEGAAAAKSGGALQVRLVRDAEGQRGGVILAPQPSSHSADEALPPIRHTYPLETS